MDLGIKENMLVNIELSFEYEDCSVKSEMVPHAEQVKRQPVCHLDDGGREPCLGLEKQDSTLKLQETSLTTRRLGASW